MPQKYILYSLDVGQGMSTFFEYYSNSDEPKANALFDLGSTKSSKKAGPPTLNFLKDQIIKRKPPDGFIDVVFLSHKDGDHINLLGALLELVPKAGVGLVRYGGRYNWYKNRTQNILTDLAKRIGDPESRLKGFPIGHSNWDKKTQEFGIPIWMGSSYSAFLLAANTPYKNELSGAPETSISLRPDGDQANSKSLVIALFMGDTCAIIGGDATYPTFQYINGFFGAKFNNNIMTLLPHHGSRKTTFGLSSTNAKASDEVRQVVKTYAGRMNGSTVVASADTKHAHPSLDIIDTFVAYTDKAKTWWSDPALNGFHYQTAYVDLDFDHSPKIPKEYTTLQTKQNIYSTLYYFNIRKTAFSYAPFVAPPATPPPTDTAFSEGMNWIYTSNSGSSATTLVGTSSNRLDTTLAMLLREDFVPGAPLPQAPRVIPPATATVSMRLPAAGVPRAAVAVPRASSAFSRLVSMP
jgi:hypothetical protein